MCWFCRMNQIYITTLFISIYFRISKNNQTMDKFFPDLTKKNASELIKQIKGEKVDGKA